jgi:hypothetical protein
MNSIHLELQALSGASPFLTRVYFILENLRILRSGDIKISTKLFSFQIKTFVPRRKENNGAVDDDDNDSERAKREFLRFDFG